ncbi:hypothetical protein C0J52_14807 [Blattella germanica]|nr:hypothetical protein C0J52_14807 [Blattella germanica]
MMVSKAKQKVMTHMAKMRGKTSQTIVDPGCSSPCSEVNTIDNKRILTLQSSTEPFLPHTGATITYGWSQNGSSTCELYLIFVWEICCHLPTILQTTQSYASLPI